jgi:hypothetical protein
MDTSQFNSTFWLAISASISAFILVLIGAINKSKCKTFECCCIKCIRDIKSETELEEFKIEHHIPESPINRV